MLQKKYFVIAVDDSPDDLLFLEMAFRKAEKLTLVQMITNGEEALSYLAGQGKYADRDTYPFPDVILLDLKMPRVSGFDVLERMRQLKLTVEPMVIILSSSFLPEDMQRGYLLGARQYQVKPSNYLELAEYVKKLENYMALLHSGAAN